MAESVTTFERSNIENSDLRNNREERKRTTTDIAPLVVYWMFIAAWIGIAIYAYINSAVSPLEIVGIEMRFLWSSLTFSPVILFFIWFCIFLIVFYFIMLRWCTQFTVYLTIFLEFLFITVLLILITISIPAIGIPFILICYLLFWIEIQIVRKVGVHIICKIIIDGCKASVAFPSSLFIVLLSLFSNFSYCTFVATVIYALANQHATIIRDDTVYSQYNYRTWKNVYEMRETEAFIVGNHGLIITFFIISGWILVVENLCMLSVLHGMFSSWCRMTNQSVPPRSLALRYLFYAYRYHTGSFAFMTMPFSSIIHIIRIICNNIHILEMKFKESPYNIYCFLVILGNIVSNSSIASASYGECFYPSMKNAFKILLNHPIKFAAVRLVTTGMIFFGLTLIPSIMIGIAYVHVLIWNPINYGIYLAVSGLLSIVITTVVLVIFGAAVDSVLFCHLEDEDELVNGTVSVAPAYMKIRK